jgi:uncharacterized protein (TIGR00369 family)
MITDLQDPAMHPPMPTLDPTHRPDLKHLIESMPASRWLGLEVIGFAAGVARLDVPVRAELTFDGRTVQGGITGMLADYAAVGAATAALPEGWLSATTGFDVELFEPARGSRLIAIGRAVRVTQSQGMASAEIYTVSGDDLRLVAAGYARCRILPVSRRDGEPLPVR